MWPGRGRARPAGGGPPATTEERRRPYSRVGEWGRARATVPLRELALRAPSPPSVAAPARAPSAIAFYRRRSGALRLTRAGRPPTRSDDDERGSGGGGGGHAAAERRSVTRRRFGGRSVHGGGRACEARTTVAVHGRAPLDRPEGPGPRGLLLRTY